MSNPDPDFQIQPGPSPSPIAADAGVSESPDASPFRTRMAGTLFGAVAGIPLGAAVAGICYWLDDYGDYAWQGAAYGSAAGALGGALIGYLERTARGDLVKWDIATYIGVIFGLVISALVLIGFGGPAVSRLFLGLLFAGPMGGLLFGAVLDRAFDGISERAWSSAIGFGAFGVAGCLAIVFVIAEYSDPDPEEVANDTRKLVADKWRADPLLKAAKIQKVALDSPVHRVYTGVMEASLDGNVQRFDVRVEVRRDNITAEWAPRN